MRAFLLSTLLTATVISASAADCQTSTLNVHTDRRLPIKVYVDGATGSNPATVNVIVNGITPGTHQLRVVEVHSNRYGVRFHRTVYTGTVQVKPAVYMDARVDAGQGIAIHNTPMDCDQQRMQQPVADATGPGQTASAATPSTSAPATPAPAQTSSAVPATTAVHMSDADFKKLVATITASKYESKKLDTLKATIDGGRLATDQVRQLMNLFSFESNKLDVAKTMYDHTVDKQNYGALTASFNFEANKDEFKKFLSAK